MADEEKEKIRTLELQGQVGLDALPNQLMKKIQDTNYTFNILCVGTTGIGKSTLLNNLFFKDLEKEEEGSHDYGETRLITKTHQLEEGKMKLKLTVVETVGFADQLNHEESSDPILEYIDAQFKRFLDEELKIKRSLWNLHDSRIHACLYFISPNGHSLKALDLVTMKKLDSKVNLIPLIAKADSLTRNELVNFKIKVMSELVSNGVQFYQGPTDDEDIADINSSLNAQLPFAVIGSNEDITVGNKTVKGRMYPWGSIQVENENHSDLVKLRQMLLQVNMEDLRDQTHERHYELYRRCKLEEMGFKDPSCDNQSFSLQKTYEAKRKEFLKELQHKEESMRQMFVNKVKEAEVELKEKEKELQGRFEHLKTMHQEEKKNLEEKKREMEEEMNAFNRRKVAAETLMGQAVQGSSQHPFKKDKDKKN